MKKLFLQILCLILLPSTTAFSYPRHTHVIFTCPCSNELINSFGSISGQGTELILLQNNTINFSGFQSNVPVNLGNYSSSGIDYDGALAKVTCSYTSSNPEEPVFAIDYFMTNGYGGLIEVRSLKTMSIVLPLGVI